MKPRGRPLASEERRTASEAIAASGSDSCRSLSELELGEENLQRFLTIEDSMRLTDSSRLKSLSLALELEPGSDEDGIASLACCAAERRATLQFVDSAPVQIALLILILVDISITVAQAASPLPEC